MSVLYRHIVFATAIGIAFSGFMSCEPEKVAMSMPVRTPAIIEENVHDTRHEWHAGETIGVYMLEEGTRQLITEDVNVPYQTLTGDGFFTPVDASQAIELPFLGESATFFAYYPYRAELGGETSDPLWSISDWDVQQQDWHSVDLLVADYVIGRSKLYNLVQFAFRHQFAMIKLNLAVDDENTDLEREDLFGVVITISNASRSVICQLFSKTLTQGATTDQLIHFNVSPDAHAAVVILPPDDSMVQGADRRVTITLANGNSYQWSIDDSVTLEAGCCYVWDVTLSGNSTVEAELQGSITDWSDNIFEDDIELESEPSI